MPKAAHEALKRQAKKKGLTGKARDRYIYGTLNKLKRLEQSKQSKRKSKR